MRQNGLKAFLPIGVVFLILGVNGSPTFITLGAAFIAIGAGFAANGGRGRGGRRRRSR